MSEQYGVGDMLNYVYAINVIRIHDSMNSVNYIGQERAVVAWLVRVCENLTLWYSKNYA